MKFLGIDYGEKEIGIAVSDESAKFAFPYGVIDNISLVKVLKEIKKICEENKIRKIIIGQSLDFKNAPNPIMKRINKFKLILEKEIKISTDFENETLTTQQAKRLNKNGRKIHSSAAALILQSYLDKKGNIC